MHKCWKDGMRVLLPHIVDESGDSVLIIETADEGYYSSSLLPVSPVYVDWLADRDMLHLEKLTLDFHWEECSLFDNEEKTDGLFG